MGVTNGIIDTTNGGITIDNVQTQVGFSGNTLQGICANHNINMWSKYRPTAGGRIHDRKKSDGTDEHTEVMYGFDTNTFNLSNIPLLKPENQPSTVNGDFRPNLQWLNILPTLTYCRLGDFENYWHTATPPFKIQFKNIQYTGLNNVFEMDNGVEYKNLILSFDDIIGTQGGGSASALAQLKIGFAVINHSSYERSSSSESTFAKCFVFPITMQTIFFYGNSGTYFVSYNGTSYTRVNSADETTIAVLSYSPSNIAFGLNPKVIHEIINSDYYWNGDKIYVRMVLVNDSQSDFVLKNDFSNCYSFELKQGFGVSSTPIEIKDNPSTGNYVYIQDVRNCGDFYGKASNQWTYNKQNNLWDWHHINYVPDESVFYFENNCYLVDSGLETYNSVKYRKFKLNLNGSLCSEFCLAGYSSNNANIEDSTITKSHYVSITILKEAEIIGETGETEGRDVSFQYVEINSNVLSTNNQYISEYKTQYSWKKYEGSGSGLWITIESGDEPDNTTQLKYCTRIMNQRVGDYQRIHSELIPAYVFSINGTDYDATSANIYVYIPENNFNHDQQSKITDKSIKLKLKCYLDSWNITPKPKGYYEIEGDINSNY